MTVFMPIGQPSRFGSILTGRMVVVLQVTALRLVACKGMV